MGGGEVSQHVPKPGQASGVGVLVAGAYLDTEADAQVDDEAALMDVAGAGGFLRVLADDGSLLVAVDGGVVAPVAATVFRNAKMSVGGFRRHPAAGILVNASSFSVMRLHGRKSSSRRLGRKVTSGQNYPWQAEAHPGFIARPVTEPFPQPDSACSGGLASAPAPHGFPADRREPPLIAFYADDFTGSTDALETLAQAGLNTRLFLDPPSAEKLAGHPGLQAVGVAGFTRALAPDAMGRELRPAFSALHALGPRHVHYKVCSTFDSSPEVGSIGRALDVGAEIFGTPTVPILVGAPGLGRYCAFGQLFARYGIGSNGAIHRLDRHPSISRHPVTPMTEADLRVHLGKQTDKRIGLLSVLELELAPDECAAALRGLVEDGNAAVLIDSLNLAHQARAGALIDSMADSRTPLFSIGSSGVEAALAAHWNFPVAAIKPMPALETPLLVVSGSCSPVTAGQIDLALAEGFTGVELRPNVSAENEVASAAVAAIEAGRHALIYTSRGAATGTVDASELGSLLGRIAREIVARTGVQRLIVAGGDTSSYAGRALGIESLEMLAPLSPGAPLCRAHAPGSPVDGLEVTFKGGQVGAPDYFILAAGGK